MARPTRTDNLVKHLMINRRGKTKEIKDVEKKPKDPEDVKRLLEMWQKNKKK
ncbi:hypothetical protein HY500_03250 [Candidatus Woesearchaeota archaeon]|nr:hypothetical protein [Candidatus Woesearchaeota archaeon]